MLQSGLVSITFRQLSIEQIVARVASTGLAGIEWGGDVHVPHGDHNAARRARRCCEDAGIACCAYGSYYRAGEPADETNPDFQSVLETAHTLEVSSIRVWAGRRGSGSADESYRARVEADLQRIGTLAAAARIVVTCEFHAGSLTDTNDSALRFYQTVNHPNVHALWQPPFAMPVAECTAGLKNLLPWLWNLHVFEWTEIEGQRQRDPLENGTEHWQEWIRIAAGTGRLHWALLEFLAGDDPDLLAAEARTLNALIACT